MRHRFFNLALFGASTLALGWQSLLAAPVWEANPTGNTGALKAQIQTAGSYDAHSGNATRVVNDLQIPGALGDYGLDFTRYWNSVHNDYDDDHADWSMDFGMSGWSHSWHWTASYGEDGPYEVPGTDHTDQKYITSITITFPDGHTTKYKIERCGPGAGVCPVYDPRFGPPYDYTERTDPSHFPYGGPGVNDHICDMAPNGREFRLCRADGGSVHFLQGDSGYQADEVVDPHGFKTELKYNQVTGNLERVEQEGGRFLEIEWAWYPNGGWAIKQVKPGGSDDSKAVTYTYTMAGPFFVLGTVTYPRESWEAQTATAVYYYGGCFVDGIHGECSAPSTSFPLLKRANDPHYGGPMTVIRYDYRGMACPTPPPRPPGAVTWYNEHVQAQAYAITAEKSDAGVLVSGFQLLCDTGERLEYNGLGGQRKFYYGRAAHTVPPSVTPRGYSLGKLTDFTTSPLSLPHNSETQPCPQGASCHRQNFYFNTLPFQIWDGRNNLTTQFGEPGDDSGEPARIEYPGGGNSTYNRTDATGSLDLDGLRMHNPYNHWLFSQKDENDKYTTYRRDERRRVTRIEYPGSIVEEYTYNGLNQVETHTLPSGAVQHYEYDPGTHLLMREWNSVDGSAEDTKYTYDDLGRVATVQNPRARANGKDFSTRMTYNGQHQIVAVEYAGMNDSSDNPPKVQYGYDTYGNCTLIIDELGHRKYYTYDSYRRCTSLTEELNAPAWNGNGNVYSRQWLWYYDREIDGVMKPASAHTSKEWRVQIEPIFNEAGERRVTTRTHDVNNRMTSETTGLIQPWSQPIGQWVASPANVETHYFTYDENGQKQTYKDPLGRITDYTYDSRNRPKDVIEPKRNDQLNRPTTTTEYDFAGNKTKVTFPDGKTQRWEGTMPTASPHGISTSTIGRPTYRISGGP
ncbi:MAG TPA: hypothetical protein VJU77_12410 [Chthoniobacterales bacterium]|nr:hypothetical protein [Chthoniobacterales bacterium]